MKQNKTKYFYHGHHHHVHHNHFCHLIHHNKIMITMIILASAHPVKHFSNNIFPFMDHYVYPNHQHTHTHHHSSHPLLLPSLPHSYFFVPPLSSHFSSSWATFNVFLSAGTLGHLYKLIKPSVNTSLYSHFFTNSNSNGVINGIICHVT